MVQDRCKNSTESGIFGIASPSIANTNMGFFTIYDSNYTSDQTGVMMVRRADIFYFFPNNRENSDKIITMSGTVRFSCPKSKGIRYYISLLISSGSPYPDPAYEVGSTFLLLKSEILLRL